MEPTSPSSHPTSVKPRNCSFLAESSSLSAKRVAVDVCDAPKYVPSGIAVDESTVIDDILVNKTANSTKIDSSTNSTIQSASFLRLNMNEELKLSNERASEGGFVTSTSCIFTREDDYDPWTYENQAIMAPMVRVSTLPSRLTARDYGCRMSYSEEIVAKKLIRCSRYVTPSGLIVFNEEDKNNAKSTAKTLVTFPGERLSLQLGVSNGVEAIQAAEIIGNDVRAIDINMGCPKLFSLQGAMGAALLTEPDTVRDIVSSLRRNTNLPVTCKIRMLADPKVTVQLVQMLESMGVAAIGVHARYRDDRPRHRALPLEQMRLLNDSISIPLLYNGDIFVTEDIDRYRALTGCSSVLIARGAMWNYSIFNYHNRLIDGVFTPGLVSTSSEKSLRSVEDIRKQTFPYPLTPHGTNESSKGHSYDWGWGDDEERNREPTVGSTGMRPLYEVSRKYLDYSIATDNAVQNSKYILSEMLKSHKGVASLPGYQKIHTAKILADLEEALELIKEHPVMSLSSTEEKYQYRNPNPPNKFQPRPEVGEKVVGGSKKHKTELKILQSAAEKEFTHDHDKV